MRLQIRDENKGKIGSQCPCQTPQNEEEQREDSEDMNEDINYNNKFNLLHIINDAQALFEYCIILRKKYRKALKQLNNLDEDDTRAVFSSYLKMDVSVKYYQFGIENKNNDNYNETNEDFWDFVF